MTTVGSGDESKSEKSGSGIWIDRKPLAYPAFRRLWLSGVVSISGAQLTVIAVPLQVYAITGSSAYVGLVGVFTLAPLIVFGLWGGALADVIDRRKLLLGSSYGMVLATSLLFVQALLSVHNIWLLYAILVLQQACIAINQPTRNAIFPRILPAQHIAAANTLEMTVIQIGGIVGSLAAGVFIAIGGPALAYLLDSAAMLVAVWAAYTLPALPPSGQVTKSGLREISFGLVYVSSHRLIMAVFVIDLIAMVAGLPRALFPEMAEKSFHTGPGEGEMIVGVLFAAMAIGSVLGGVFSGWVPKVRRHGVAVIVGVVIWGVGITGFGLSALLGSGGLVLAVFFLAIAGVGDLISVIFRSTMIQQIATDDVRGRLQGLFNVTVAGGQRLGDFSHGITAALVGTTIAVSGGGVLVVLAAILLLLAIPITYRYRFDPTCPTDEPAALDRESVPTKEL
ncbi:MFS transporter [Nocardia mangyaensis]|nr:MFS transporter [Nocardia mangyaensis]MDO3646205.1 MFS transporter [Nocardia mangyaensis]